MKSLVLVPFALFPIALAPVPAEPTYAIDPVHSSVVFRVKHSNAAWFWGTFGKVEGEFTLDPAAGNVSVRIDAESINTRNEGRDKHLKGTDFFDVKQFPTITFAGSKVTKVKDSEFKVDGELDLHGVKKPLSVTVTKTGEGQMRGKTVTGWETEFTIKRSEFGMKYGVAEGALGDEVKVTLSLEAGAKGGAEKK